MPLQARAVESRQTRLVLSVDVGLRYLYDVINDLYYGILVLVIRCSACLDACTAITGRL